MTMCLISSTVTPPPLRSDVSAFSEDACEKHFPWKLIWEWQHMRLSHWRRLIGSCAPSGAKYAFRGSSLTVTTAFPFGILTGWCKCYMSIWRAG